ncbi:leukocyte receptor cluster member 9 isoform X2 [Eucyclogobius newberryi]|uniref:leukocyte receptor cluster member 9 isoform X2 n=1 Tax=Eucyclogobius newberryi TaxID=166745 RepID=UPI003B59E345
MASGGSTGENTGENMEENMGENMEENTGETRSSAEQRGNDAHHSDTIPGQRLTSPPLPNAPEEEAELDHQGENPVVLCQYFVMGKCRFGDKCRWSHSEPLLDDSEAVSANKTDEENEENGKKKKVKGKQKPNYKEKETNKKPRMRTADDVISRILWDPPVDPAQVVVGYVDRFLGVLERPFCEFNWETTPIDCDYNTELALPRHRIQYFTYRGQRVWDRHSRTDRVFGSTGQALAPPFGGEGEVEDAARPALAEDVLPVASGPERCTASARLEDQDEMDVDTPESAAQSKQRAQEQPGLQETCATNRVRTSSANVEMNGSTNEDEGNQKDLNARVEALGVDDKPDGKHGARPPRKRPTHFITFRANTPSILSGFAQLQAELTAARPSSAPHWCPASSLHVTLCLLTLPGPREVEAAADMLRRFAEWDRNPPVALTFPPKLKHFGGRVLYLSPQPQLRLQQLNSGLQEAYRDQGLLHRDSYNPRYHLTLAKQEDREAPRVFEGVENLRVGKGLNLGRLPVNTLHLCAMGGDKADGFYEILCTVTLR